MLVTGIVTAIPRTRTVSPKPEGRQFRPFTLVEASVAPEGSDELIVVDAETVDSFGGVELGGRYVFDVKHVAGTRGYACRWRLQTEPSAAPPAR